MKKLQRSWALQDISQTLTSGTPFTSVDLFSDAEASFGTPSKTVRLLGSVNINWTGWDVSSVNRHLWIGLARIDQDLSANLDPSSADMADRHWLWREPLGYSPLGTGISGTGTSVISWTHKIDWQVRRGRGSQLQKDDAMVICSGVLNPAVGMSVQLHFSILSLQVVY